MTTGEQTPKKATAKEAPDFSLRLIFTEKRSKRLKAVRVKKLQITQEELARDLKVDAATVSRLEGVRGLETWTPEITVGLLKRVLGSRYFRYIQTGKGHDELEFLVNTWSQPTKVYDSGGIPSDLKPKAENLPDPWRGPENEDENEDPPKD